MNPLDWVVLVGTLGLIVGYGLWKSRHVASLEDFVRGGNTMRWPTIGLGIMATQASAITFLSTPGQAYADGMRFVQFYLGLPLAMIVISAFFVPVYYRLKVYTAYEYLEHRFDVRVRVLGAFIFLLSRGLAAGITLYAPSIILSAVLGWPLEPTIWAMGLLVIAYTVAGGNAAVSVTQKHQMVVMLGGLFVAAVLVILRLPAEVSLGDAVKLAGALDRMNVVSFELDLADRYSFWSGLTGGFFLALAYFGTDQSQVARYLSGRSVSESRLGLLFNGLFKIPMQFVILFVGVMVFVFYLFNRPPVFFNTPTLERVAASEHAPALAALEARHDAAWSAQRAAALAYVDAPSDTTRAELRAAAAEIKTVRTEAKALIKTALPGAETKDTDYVFVSYVLEYVPSGLVGLLIAVILCAAMSSTAAELSALGTTSMIDLWRRLRRRRGGAAAPESAESASPDARADVRLSKLFTVLWGLVALGFASFASLLSNLIEAVNILGSIFYGTMLGLFVTAFFLPFVSATPVLLGALAAQSLVVTLFYTSSIGFLWFNVIGCFTVVLVAALAEGGRRLAVR